jgi:hypothetical protein
MNRLMQRLSYLESRIISEGRMIGVFEDAHFESTEARIDRCLAEEGRSPLDFIVVLRDFGDRASPAGPGSALEGGPATGVAQSSNPLSGLLRPAEKDRYARPHPRPPRGS